VYTRCKKFWWIHTSFGGRYNKQNGISRRRGGCFPKSESPDTILEGDHSTKVWLQLVQWFLRRRLKCEMLTDRRWTKSDGNSSHGLKANWAKKLTDIVDPQSWYIEPSTVSWLEMRGFKIPWGFNLLYREIFIFNIPWSSKIPYDTGVCIM
jgi:hypothetical protein